MAELLLANKADVNAKNDIRRTPLQRQRKMGQKDMVELLLANKADVNAKDNAVVYDAFALGGIGGPQGHGRIVAGQQSRCQCQRQIRRDAFA